MRLGDDTISVDRFTLTATRLEIDQAIRTIRVRRRHAVVEFGADGAVVAVDACVREVGAAAEAIPLHYNTAVFAGDSVSVEMRPDTSVRKVRAAVPAGTAVPVVSPWAMYDMLSMRLVASHRDSLHLPLYYLGATNLSWVALRRLGKDSIDIESEFNRYHAKVDRAGRVQAIRPLRGTDQYTVERQAGLEVNAFATAFAKREQQAGLTGLLSPRDTATAQAGPATLWIDYGRPAVRGRTIFGGVGAWDEVWRTGANAATQFRTDRGLSIGGTLVPAGMYTLWTLPTDSGWTLIINSETGQWGTEYKPEKDLYRIPMSLSPNSALTEQFLIHIAPDGNGGQIHFVWEHTVAAVDFTVQP